MRSSTVDIHTHMVDAGWLELVSRRGAPELVLTEGPSGPLILGADGEASLRTNPRMLDYEARIAAMDEYGIDVAVVSLTSPNVYFGDGATSALAARLINDAMAAAQAAHPDRIRFLASLPFEHPDLALAELERAAGIGAAGLIVLCNVRGRDLTDDLFAPVWRGIEVSRLPVLLHPTDPPGSRSMGLSAVRASIGFPIDTTLAVAKLVVSGFFDTFPGLELIVAHAGGALPYLAGRLDLFELERATGERRIVAPPSEYLRRLRYDAVTYQHDALAMLVDLVGEERVLFGTDWPHPTDVPRLLAQVDALGPGASERVRGANAAELLSVGGRAAGAGRARR